MDLPKYVTKNGNKQGREYYLYRRGRRTKNQWPTLRLPHYDDHLDFSLRHDQYSRMSFDGENWTYQCNSGLNHNIEEPVSEDIEQFWYLLDELDEKGKKFKAYEGKTFFALVDQYINSTEFISLAEKTKYDYSRYLEYIESNWGYDPVFMLNTVEAQKAIDKMKDTPSAAKQFRAVLKTLISWGISRGFHDRNPVEHTQKPKGGNPYVPWPDWAFELFFEKARKDMIGPVISALYTGQRAIDVFKMNRILSTDVTISIKAQKTGVFVPVPIHPHYKQLLANFPSNSNFKLHLMDDGKPWTLGGYRTAFQREMNRPEFEPFREHRLVFHGLRKNAVNALAEAGATDSEISAVVGMSLQMVAHYTKDAKLKNIAQNCFNRIKNEWEISTPNTLSHTASSKRLQANSSKLQARNK